MVRHDTALKQVIETATRLRADKLMSEEVKLNLGSVIAHAEEALAIIEAEQLGARVELMRRSGLRVTL